MSSGFELFCTAFRQKRFSLVFQTTYAVHVVEILWAETALKNILFLSVFVDGFVPATAGLVY